MTNHFIVEADGGSRGNPGSSGSGAVIIDAETGELVREISVYIGVATNNVAEYRALLAAIQEVLRLDDKARVTVRMDSKLVIEQMRGAWKIKHPDMRALASEIGNLTQTLDVEYVWIPRELNSRADSLANLAMDMRASLEPGLLTQIDSNKAETQVSVKGEEIKPSSVRAPGSITKLATTLILVRHGRTHLTESQRISGRGGSNPSLSVAGRQDALSVADEISEFGRQGVFGHLNLPSALISSPIARTVETAGTIAKKLSLSIETAEEFAEISFGDWDGLTYEEAEALSPDTYDSWRGSWTVAPPNGESLEEFDLRVQRGLEKVLESHAGETVVVVSHVMPIRGLVRKALGAGANTYWSMQVAPCSISVVRFWGNQASEVIAVNSTKHLA